ncbi:hypothetical protein [Roseobacter sinensis]|uniref:Uncharacterized protein n=1 Tax=Roseobacter sinensis TaxID=2931391 RepID=A0ABT3BFV8_9RHOB|nr:hypothetical protein [Roseobacter sp. WL0113]MCV3272471.1 hypothetical protein [Roseobacter sp. WL0113]
MLAWLALTYFCLTSCAICFWRLGMRTGGGFTWRIMCVLAASGPLLIFLMMVFNIVGLDVRFVADLGRTGGSLLFFWANVLSPVLLTAMLWTIALRYQPQVSGGQR